MYIYIYLFICRNSYCLYRLYFMIFFLNITDIHRLGEFTGGISTYLPQEMLPMFHHLDHFCAVMRYPWEEGTKENANPTFLVILIYIYIWLTISQIWMIKSSYHGNPIVFRILESHGSFAAINSKNLTSTKLPKEDSQNWVSIGLDIEMLSQIL